MSHDTYFHLYSTDHTGLQTSPALPGPSTEGPPDPRPAPKCNNVCANEPSLKMYMNTAHGVRIVRFRSHFSASQFCLHKSSFAVMKCFFQDNNGVSQRDPSPEFDNPTAPHLKPATPFSEEVSATSYPGNPGASTEGHVISGPPAKVTIVNLN